MYSAQQILDQLDGGAEDFSFPMLDNGYYYHGDQRLTIFRDEKRWAMLIEVLVYNNHEYGIEGITVWTHTFGNCILTPKLYDNDNYFQLARDAEEQTFIESDEPPYSYVNPDARTFLIKGDAFPIVSDPDHYRAKGIALEYEPKISPVEFMRGFIPELSRFFWLTREEMSKKIPVDIPVLMTIDEWHHPDLVNGENPSDMETFRQLAEVIVTGDKTLYRPIEAANTHWRNWPEGGTL